MGEPGKQAGDPGQDVERKRKGVFRQEDEEIDQGARPSEVETPAAAGKRARQDAMREEAGNQKVSPRPLARPGPQQVRPPGERGRRSAATVSRRRARAGGGS